MNDFKAKVVVITGAGSGIGRALALSFNRLGAKLALNDFSETTLLETVALLPGSGNVYQAVFDVSNKADFYQFAANVRTHYGHVDVVINNAGVAIAKLTAAEVSIEDYEWILGVNLWGMIYGSLAFLPHLRKQKESSLVNVSSVFGIHGIPYQAAYCTTKFGILGFTESVALEERMNKTGVTVTSVHPGGIKTNIARNSRYADHDTRAIEQFEKSFITSPEKAAETIINGIRRKKLRVLVGPDARLLYLMNKISPKLLAWYVLRFARQLD